MSGERLCPVHISTSSSSVCRQYWISLMACNNCITAAPTSISDSVWGEKSDLCWAAAGLSCTNTRRGKPAAEQTRWKSSASARTGRPCRAVSSAPWWNHTRPVEQLMTGTPKHHNWFTGLQTDEGASCHISADEILLLQAICIPFINLSSLNETLWDAETGILVW